MQQAFATLTWGVAALMWALTGCGQPPDLVGAWSGERDEGSLEFRDDGQVIVVDEQKGTVRGRYVVEAEDRIVLRLDSTDILRDGLESIPEEVRTATISLDGDQLTMKIEGEDRAAVYRRRDP